MLDPVGQNRSDSVCRKVSVSIGMPVFNGGPSVAKAIQCILGQTHADFELLISDNCSTDETGEICLALTRHDPRVRYVRQPKNIGADANFRYVYLQSCGDYFMWAAADDLRSVNFLEVNLTFLRTHPDYVGSTSPVRFADGSFDELKMGDFALANESPHQRVLDFLSRSHANGRFYSLFKRTTVATWPHLDDSYFLGADWTLVSHAAKCGKLHRSAAGWVAFGTDGMSNRVDAFKRFRKSRLDWLIPYRRMSFDILEAVHEASFPIRARVFFKLLILNTRAFLLQFLLGHRRRLSGVSSGAEARHD